MKPDRSAFTILELMVSMAVLMILVVVLLGIVDGATKLWRENEGRVESFREARAALHLIENELRAAYPGPATNLFVTTLTGQPSVSTNDSALAFVTQLPGTAQSPENRSEYCAVAYYLDWRQLPDSDEAAGYHLMRAFTAGNQTFQALTNNQAVPLLENLGNTGEARELLARNVAGFSVIPLYTNASGLTRTPPAGKTFPDLVELRIRALNNEGARQLTTPEEWQDTNNPVLLRNQREFVTRVRLPRPVNQP